MKFLLKPTDPAKLEVDFLISFCWENEKIETKFNGKLVELIKEAVKKEGFSGKPDQYLTLSTKGFIGAYKLLLAGLGRQEDFDLYNLRKVVASTIKKSKEGKPAKIAIVMDHFWLSKFAVSEAVQAVVEAVSLASYRFLKYKSEKEKEQREPEEVIFQLPPSKLAAGEAAMTQGTLIAQAACFARDLVNEPAVVTTPSYLAEVAANIGKESEEKIKVRIFEKGEIEKFGMGAVLGVAKGSDEPPKFIHLTYKPARFKKKIVIVGKGITFDTGGLSLKNSESMQTMKIDMAGAAAVLSVFKVLPQLGVQNQVIGLIAACENMPSGKSLRPGDILKTVNGKTIEVLNTDAEGRLTLADVLSWAVLREKPDYLIDLATLTGACMVALGQEVAGLWGNKEDPVEKIKKAAKATSEKIWQMPLETEYRELIKSDIADLKNIQTGKYGGAITAALFLSEFVGNIPWAHLDIAGPAYAEKDSPLVPKGGTGFGVRLLLHFLKEI